MKDAWLHAFAALLICTVFIWASTPWIYMALANGIFWFGRELAQSFGLKKISRKKRERNPLRWSRHKHIEWLLPTAVGIISSYVSYRYL